MCSMKVNAIRPAPQTVIVEDFVAKAFKGFSITTWKEQRNTYVRASKSLYFPDSTVHYQVFLSFIPLNRGFSVGSVTIFQSVSYHTPDEPYRSVFAIHGYGNSMWPVVERGYVPESDESLFTDILEDKGAREWFAWFKKLSKIWKISVRYDATRRQITYFYGTLDKGGEQWELLYMVAQKQLSITVTSSAVGISSILSQIPGLTVEKATSSISYTITDCTETQIMEVVGLICQLA